MTVIKTLKRWKYRFGVWLLLDLYAKEPGEVKMMISLSENLVGLNRKQQIMQMRSIIKEAEYTIAEWTTTEEVENV